MSTPILRPTQRWYCPNCRAEDVTHEAQAHTRFHPCAKRAGFSLPMVPYGVAAKVEVREREDYIGTEHVQLDADGRPVMSAITTRDDGTDVAVYAPLATGTGEV
jgi:hypothetical protein